MCDRVIEAGSTVIADFVCPTEHTRGAFGEAFRPSPFGSIASKPDASRIPTGLFAAPGKFDLRVGPDGTLQYWAEQALARLRPAFDPQKPTALFHRALPAVSWRPPAPDRGGSAHNRTVASKNEVTTIVPHGNIDTARVAILMCTKDGAAFLGPQLNSIAKAQRCVVELVKGAAILVLASHSEAIVRRTFNKAVLLRQGMVAHVGDVDEVLLAYRGRTEADGAIRNRHAHWLLTLPLRWLFRASGTTRNSNSPSCAGISCVSMDHLGGEVV